MVHYLVSSSGHSYLVESHELFDYSDAAFRRSDMSAGHSILGEIHTHHGYGNFLFDNHDIRDVDWRSLFSMRRS